MAEESIEAAVLDPEAAAKQADQSKRAALVEAMLNDIARRKEEAKIAPPAE